MKQNFFYLDVIFLLKKTAKVLGNPMKKNAKNFMILIASDKSYLCKTTMIKLMARQSGVHYFEEL